MGKSKQLLIRVGLLVLMVGLMPAPSYAAPKPSAPSGITLSPFEQHLTIDSSTAAQSFNLTLTNHTASLQEIDLSARDFGSLNDTGGVLLEGSNSYTQQYGLVSWLGLGTNTVIIRPGESQAVPITVTNRTDLQPGGHYGAIVASVNSLDNQTGNHVTINQQLLSLVLVDKTGGEHFAMNLDGVSQNGNWLHLPNTIELRFKNPGNVEVTPRGLVKLESPGGRVIAQGIINQASAFILPESFYDMYVPLTTVAQAWPLPGVYRVVVQYRYDGLNNYATKGVAVRFIDLKAYLLLVVLVAVAWRLWKHHKKASQKAAPTS